MQIILSCDFSFVTSFVLSPLPWNATTKHTSPLNEPNNSIYRVFAFQFNSFHHSKLFNFNPFWFYNSVLC